MNTDISEFKEPSFLQHLKMEEVKIGEETYTIYHEPKTTQSDRCFVFCPTGSESVHLFQIKYLGNDRTWQEALNSLNMQSTEIIEPLISTGKEIMKKVTPNLQDLRLLSSAVNISGEDYELTFQSPEVKVLGVSLEENYKKRVKARFYQ
jgi:hypothetical protein